MPAREMPEGVILVQVRLGLVVDVDGVHFHGTVAAAVSVGVVDEVVVFQVTLSFFLPLSFFEFVETDVIRIREPGSLKFLFLVLNGEDLVILVELALSVAGKAEVGLVHAVDLRYNDCHVIWFTPRLKIAKHSLRLSCKR